MKVSLQMREIKEETSPFKIYLNLKEQPYNFILESGMDHKKLGRYSFTGASPFAVFRSKGKKITIWERDRGKIREIGNPLDKLKLFLSIYDFCGSTPNNFPPFIGGGVGYFSYELGEHIEKLPGRGRDDMDIPEIYLAFYDNIYAYDHLLDKAYISSLGLAETQDEAEMKALKKIEVFHEEIIKYSKTHQKTESTTSKKGFSGEITSNFTYDEYCRAVNKVKEYIASGDIYQVNLTQRFEADLELPPLEIYKRLRQINPAPFAAYLDFEGLAIASSSPERYFKVNDNKVETRPIKGTRPRGKTQREDEKFRKELLESEKDQAELVMIIDLERNDLGRVCEPGSVKVPELIVLETYPTVYHLVSTVEGILPPDKDIVDLLKAGFPGGSITGAPKIRAMEIIDEMEGLKRGVYTGSIGYISLNGNVDLNIVIRTIVVKNNKGYIQVGGGIVADSVPELEYQETLDKARALMESLGL